MDRPPLRVLIVASSSSQMYSGIGRACFAFAERWKGRAEIEFAIDDATPRNLGIVERFAREHQMPVHVGRGVRSPDVLDCGNRDLPDLLRSGRWDVVEALCWANTATNRDVLENLGDAVLAYTPHDQPTWSVPMSKEQETLLMDVHKRMLRRSDVVYCDSPAERETLQRLVPDRSPLAFATIPLGCDFRAFRPGPWPRKEQILFVGDLAEPRKRFDRALAVFGRLRARRPGLKLVVIGNRSDEPGLRIPGPLRADCELRGYVSEADLRQAYAESLGLILLSDFEAFGIPILEALASATPVFLSEQPTTRGLFGTLRGAHFCPEDFETTLGIVEHALDRGAGSVSEVAADRRRLEATFGWDDLAESRWQALLAAWFLRHRWAIPA